MAATVLLTGATGYIGSRLLRRARRRRLRGAMPGAATRAGRGFAGHDRRSWRRLP